MKILFVDHDQVAVELVKAHLEPVGHEVVYEPSKAAIAEHLQKDVFDVVMIDPSPVKDPRSIILDIRRHASNYPYVIWLSETIQAEPKQSGANIVIGKPIDKAQLDEILDHARDLTRLVARIGDNSEDFPSAGGVIAKSAFNQLFLSSIDRATRYSEASYALFISVENHGDIVQKEGGSAGDYAVAKLSQALVKIRRQSDIIGQTAVNEYALLLQRPVYESEPVDAANRFAQSLSEMEDLLNTSPTAAQIKVQLVSVPDGQTVIAHHITKMSGA